MITLKSKAEIEAMAEGGQILKQVLREIEPLVKQGATTAEINNKAEKHISKAGAEASFKTVHGYTWATCVPVNNQAVHTPPSNRVLQHGDIVTIDIGILHKGLHTDHAETYPVGEVKPEVGRFLDHGRRTLLEAIKLVKPGGYLGTVSQYIQEQIEGNGYFILKELTGHGVGRKLHEDPYVFNYLDRPVQKTPLVRPGLTIAVEIIYSLGTEQIAYEKDNEWSIVTSDGSLSACFERTVAVREDKAYILT